MVSNVTLTTIAVFALLVEIFLFCWITKIVKNSKSLTIKDTRFYPVIIMLAIVIFTSVSFVIGKENILDSFLNSLHPALKSVGLEFDVEIAKTLKGVDTLMMVAYYGLCLASLYGFVTLIINLVRITIVNWFRIRRAKSGGKFFNKSNKITVDSVYSYNETTKKYLENLTLEEKRRTIVYINSDKAKKSSSETKKLKSYYYSLKIPFAFCKFDENSFSKNAVEKAENNFISFLEDNNEVYEFTKNAKEYVDKNIVIIYLNSSNISASNPEYIRLIDFLLDENVPYEIYNYDNERYQKALEEHNQGTSVSNTSFLNNVEEISMFIDSNKNIYKLHTNVRFIISTNRDQNHFLKPILANSHGFIRSFDRYELNAHIFSQDHNFAQYIRKADPTVINKNCTIKDCDINLFMIGFGKINKALFEKILITNQFVTEENGFLKPKKMNVHIYDKESELNSLILSNGIFNYRKKDYEPMKDKYFDLAEDIGNIDMNFDVNLCGLNTMPDIISKIDKNRKSFNFFIVAVGDDFIGTEIADKLNSMLLKDEKHHNFIFVKTKSSIEDIHEANNVYHFGNLNDLISRKNVVLEQFYDCCMRRHYFFLNNKNKVREDARTEAMCKQHWSQLTSIERESNVSSVAGIRFKLALLGFDDFSFNIEEYYKKYFGTEDPGEMRYNNIDLYPLGKDEPQEFTVRDVFAFMEHERWNLFEISCGVLPLAKEELLKLGGKTKSSDERYHSNICSTKGLREFYYFMHDNNLVPEHNDNVSDKAEVFRHDYKLMDQINSYQNYLKEKE